MNRGLSVLGFYLKNGIYRVLGICVLMAAAETVLLFTGDTSRANTFGDAILAVHIPIVLLGAMLLNFLFNSSILGKSSMNRMAAGKLQVSGRALFRLDVAAQMLFILVIYGVQTGILLVFARLYPGMNGVHVTELSVYIDFLRNSFLHAMLPLKDVGVILRNTFSILILAEIAAVTNLKLRTGKKNPMLLILSAYLIVRGFEAEFQQGFTTSAVFAGILLSFAAVLYSVGCSMAERKEEKDTENIEDTEEKEDE